MGVVGRRCYNLQGYEQLGLPGESREDPNWRGREAVCAASTHKDF